ncbi:hypothetical protein K474DRAFT_1711953 [Panus rudis PR-1116 ss-1]|nr:hypothetical protein K474DRAFT_1711953 [Panus rudis PR-1116 ss-1]
MSTNELDDTLSDLLRSLPSSLVYTIPLIITSLVLTFAGAFLTLDRTRTFRRPTSPALTQISRNFNERFFSWFTLGGGVGGIMIGYACGVHLSTLLALMIPQLSGCPSLGTTSFLLTTFISGIVCAIPSGRWKLVATMLSAVWGGATFALSLSVIVHPAQIVRIVLSAVLAVVAGSLCLLPSNIAHPAIRFTCAATGAFGVILSIAVLIHLSSWADIWSRYWVSDAADWGSMKEKGLSAAYCLLLILGIASDWAIHRRWGENPDERWDHYLSDYTLHLPNDPSRSGVYRPLPSFWNKLFHDKSTSPEPPLFSDFADSSDANKSRTEDVLLSSKSISISNSQSSEIAWDHFWKDVKGH